MVDCVVGVVVEFAVCAAGHLVAGVVAFVVGFAELIVDCIFGFVEFVDDLFANLVV